MPAIEAFLLGMLANMFLTAALFFLRFWRETRDPLFLAFAASFGIEGLSRLPLLFVAHPAEGATWIYWVRLFASFLIIAAILRKNSGKRG